MRNSKYLQILGICTLFSVTACSSKLEIPEPPVYNKVRNISVDLNQEIQKASACPCGDFTLVREAQNKGLIATLRMSGDGLNAFYQLMVLTIGINMKDRDGF